MKKYFFLVILFSLLPVPGFAQFLDDMPYSNADRWTYFQQEMTSLMRYQAENDSNILLFLSISPRFVTLEYKKDYLFSLTGFPYEDKFYEDKYKGSKDVNVVIGLQAKINNSLYIPVLSHWGTAESSILLEEYEYEDPYFGTRKSPMYVEEVNDGWFLGTGVFINTNVIKGGVYLGWNFLETIGEKMENIEGIYRDENRAPPPGFRIALVPLVNTSGFAYVGKVLNNVLGYLGPGNNIVNVAEAEADSGISALVSSLNTALNFTFNKIDFGWFTLSSQLIYTRGSFDAAAKNDIYGLKIQGLWFSHLGFTLEGGYKHFFSVSRFFLSDYADTGYFTGTLFYDFKIVGAGIIYSYDNIYKSRFTIACSISAPFIYFSAFVTTIPRYIDEKKFGPGGAGFEFCFRSRSYL
jgi:hypothetical protein